MKRVIVFIMTLIISLSLFACKKEKVNVISRIATNEYGYNYLEVDGKPFNYFGVESRLDAYMNCEEQTVEDFEKQFELAKKLGANVIAVPVDWADVEPEKDFYDFTIVNKLLSFAVKYDIKIEILWYSINMCGESNSYQVPAYIFNDEESYPKYDSTNKGNFWSYYGYQGYLKITDNLLKRETLVIENLMDFIYNWDLKNGETHPLIGVQVYNEPDLYPEWRVSKYDISENGKKLTSDQVWQEVKKALDNAGKAFKKAKYNVITRVNFAKLKTATTYAKDVFNLDGIDCVGNDPYTTSVGGVYNQLTDFNKDLPNNFTHYAENKGSYTNTASLLLTSAYCGAGYIIYDLATSTHFIENAGNNSLADIDHGVLNPDGTDKEHTESVRRTLKALIGAGESVIVADKKDFAVFNLEESYPEESYQVVINTKGVTANFSTEKSAVGFMIVYGDYAYFYASDESTFTISNATINEFSFGAYKKGVWTNSTGTIDAVVKDGKTTFTLNNGALLRAKVSEVKGELISNTKNFIGA